MMTFRIIFKNMTSQNNFKKFQIPARVKGKFKY